MTIGFRLKAFLSSGLPELLAASDLVSRAGATALLEFAALSKTDYIGT